ncbi:MAG: cystathionine gamma-synthase family protein [Bacteroidota bacterium]
MSNDSFSFKPESRMMSYGYKSELSEGAIKCPIFQTSTFEFKTAEDGKAFFEVAYGIRDKADKEELGLIYSRLNNPDLEILENRLCLWDDAEECAVFESGMSAITTCFLEFLRPGDILLYSNPLYGGTSHFIQHILPEWGVKILCYDAFSTNEEIKAKIRKEAKGNRLAMIYLETPANPTNRLFDISAASQLAADFATDEYKPVVAVDNTYLGPIWQNPIRHGADLVLYSATKYIGGHSDVIAGACLGSKELIRRLKGLRTFMGNMAGPWTGWLLMRSLETLKVRMTKQLENARKVADFLKSHPKVDKVWYLGHLTESDGMQYEIFNRQCESSGAMISFEVKGGEKEAFTFLNHTRLIKLAVSLGSTESLAQHPASMTHAGVDPEERNELGISEQMVRLSIGIEHSDDIISDIQQALDFI